MLSCSDTLNHPYFINIKINFTQHDLSEISELNSKYAVILYR
ncbi:TPA: replication initiation protein [Staphylococcus aureus]|nr:replication initiation protein [Staphylococcus aureus]